MRKTAQRLEPISDQCLTEALARTPADQYVIWVGRPAKGRDGSIRSRTLGLIEAAWTPVALRALVLQAARLEIPPDLARGAVRQHQAARPACYLLVRRAAGGYVAVTDVPWPATLDCPLRAGDAVLGCLASGAPCP